jgi:hypothetical protein
MTVTYTNRKGMTYTLCCGTTKTGKPRYTFVRDPEGRQVVEQIPEGWEIRESVNGLVSLARKRPQRLLPAEIAAVEKAVREHPKAHNYRVNVKPDRIEIYESVGPDLSDLMSDFKKIGFLSQGRESKLRELLESRAQFTPVLRFVLTDENRRSFYAERMCYLGGIDDWIFITEDSIDRLVRKIVPTLDTDAFFEWD